MNALANAQRRRLWLLANTRLHEEFSAHFHVEDLDLELRPVLLETYQHAPKSVDAEAGDVIAFDGDAQGLDPLLATLGELARRKACLLLAVSGGNEPVTFDHCDGTLSLNDNSSSLLLRTHLEWHERASRAERTAAALSQVTQLAHRLSGDHDIRELLSDATRTVAAVTRCERASIVLSNLAGDRAYVVSTSDDAGITELPIHMADYPELRTCLSETAPVVIEDTRESQLLAPLGPDHKLPFRSEALVPLRQDNRTQGALFARALTPQAFSPSDVELLQLIARSIEVAVANARFVEQLRLQTEQSALAKQQAIRRLNLFKPYAEFFKTSAEGMVVTDRSGQILYTNPTARHFIRAQRQLEGANVLDFLPSSEVSKARKLATQVRADRAIHAVDFLVNSATGPRCVSVNATLALRAGHSILLTFRDVTKERNTERELLQTKEFLERVIDSSVDAIVSADLTGKILVFNRAAARIFGYDATDVVQRMNVKELYPPGGAQTVARQIFGPGHGGPGRLEDYRTEMVDRRGRMVPVKLSAAVVVEGAAPVATVGVFTDIRKELQMQARLRQVHDELRETEKGVALAQLAGMTAHELNQPLTCVITYAELIARTCESSPAATQAASVLVDQAQRMAQIVRRLGQITRYETKAYVGATSILDLDKAAVEEPKRG